ncbi:MAG: Smr/MutS family protein [Acidobacteriota bacterium]
MQTRRHTSAAARAVFASDSSLEALQYFETLAVCAALASTDVGRETLLSLRPGGDAEERRRDSLAAADLVARGGALVPSWETPLGPLLDRLDDERADLEVSEVLLAARLVTASEQLLERLGESEVLAAAARRLTQQETEEEESEEDLPTVAALALRIRRTLDVKGRVRDDASPKLGQLRRQVRSHRNELYESLSSYTRNNADNLAEDTVTVRDGRLSVLLSSGSRGRLQGLIHGRSGTGKSYYFEPLEVVEANNRLQAATAEEEAERLRLLRELERAVRDRAPALVRRGRLLAYVDSLQATAYFAARARAVFPLLQGESVRLFGARHPLLEPALAELRESALGTRVQIDRLVPLDLELAENVLVVTGPNAGGKTVALKTLGLFVALAHAGLPVPAEDGTVLPALRHLVAEVGDEQSLLEGRSTFSAQLLGIKEALDVAGPGALILLDEVGSGTNPEEGAALACALLEELLERDCLALLTTHLVQVAALATELDGALAMAMEFDAERGLPTYRLSAEAAGGSHALELAQRLELPSRLLARADELLGSEHRKLRSLIAETEALKRELEEGRAALLESQEQAATRALEIDERLEQLESERRKVRSVAEKSLEEFRVEVRGQLEEAEQRMRRELDAGRRKDVSRRAVKRVFEEVSTPQLPEPAAAVSKAPPAVGDDVRHKLLGWKGRLESVEGDRVVVAAGGKKLRCKLGEIEKLVASAKALPKRRKPKVSTQLRSSTALSEINLIGERVEPALDRLDAYVDQAVLGGLHTFRVVHGHGSGRLRDAVRDFLKRHPSVAEMRSGEAGEGGNGATVAKLRGA